MSNCMFRRMSKHMSNHMPRYMSKHMSKCGQGIFVFEGMTQRILSFHFRVGSETRIDGKQYAMEMQAVTDGEAGLLMVPCLYRP